MPIEIPQLGAVSRDSEFDWYRSQPIPVKVLDDKACCIVVEAYDCDGAPEDFHFAISSFLSLDKSALDDAAPHIFAYYQDVRRSVGADELNFPKISSADEVWAHIRFGNEPIFSRRHYGDRGINVSIECECDWEPEHGLEIVFKNGRTVNKVGPYDGHLSNADAYADPSLEDVIYR